MKDEKPSTAGGFGPDYVGWSVPLTVTAYVMASSAAEAQFKAVAALRRQQRVMLTKLELLQPVELGDAHVIPVNDPPPVEAVIVIPALTRELKSGVISSAEPVIHADVKPPCKFCDAHRRDIHKRVDCTPAQECHADYWRTALKGAK